MRRYFVSVISLAVFSGFFIMIFPAPCLGNPDPSFRMGARVWAGVPLSGESASVCKQCHFGEKARELGLKDVYEEMYSYEFFHDEAEFNCPLCHTEKNFKTPETWGMFLPEIESSQRHVVFFLKGISLDRTYGVELRLDGFPQEIPAFMTFRPYGVKGFRSNDRSSPTVRNLKVEGVRKGIFLEGIISWTTDEPTVAAVEYGTNVRYGDMVFEDRVFRTSHRAALSGLKSNRVYHYRIRARDMFGNITVTEDSLLDTAKGFKHAPDAAWGVGRGSVRSKVKGRFATKLFRIDRTADTYLEVLSDEPFKAHLKIDETIEIGKHGVGLVPAVFSTMEACTACHAQGVSHPVGMRSLRADVVIPAGLPTIEGGVITCSTCHEPHGGAAAYFLRFSTEGDFCGMCHRGRSRLQ